MRRLSFALLVLPLLLAVLPGPVEAASANPFVGRPPVVEHDRAVDRALAGSSGGTRAALAVIAQRAQARWYGPWLTGTRLTADVRARATSAARQRRTAVFVAYAIPQRDCGGDSAGGLAAAAYRQWVRAFAAGVTGRPVVVLEPDALAGLDCLSPAARGARLFLLRDAVTVLSRRGAVVYLDAGHSGWQPVPTMAARLRAAGIGGARGVSLNVSAFDRTTDEIAYAKALARSLPGLHAVVDTSRNGRGPAPDAAWCNPPGRGLGSTPRAVVDPVVDALLWVKAPGESDGTCGRREPAAGTFWSRYAVGLVGRRVS
ncbi:MAG: glycoside hydrolase family 6 protein [Mycobacteriales bacterium]